MERYYIFYADKVEELERLINEFMQQESRPCDWQPSGALVVASWPDGKGATYYQAMWRK